MVSITLMANSIVVSASVLPCMQDNSAIDTSVEIQITSPCHEKQKTLLHKDCKDACYCLHFSTNQIPLFNTDIVLDISPTNEYSITNEYLISRTPPPLFKPPITIS